MTDADPQDDPVAVRRARIVRLSNAAQRVGYACFGAAIVVFAIGAVVGFTGAVVALVVAALVGATVTLAPAIVLGYAAKAAEREEREERQARERNN
jgi:ABC-type transport system involved in cytochrome bd biosynthesis fused ATPase/permease subunit